MKIFFSAGEPSGDLHGANLIRELRARQADIEPIGFGGPEMAAAGCRLDADLTALAVMWIVRALLNLHKFLALLSKADRCFRQEKPDAVVLIDFPGFNWWIARRAKAHGIPVFYYAPPQVWAWATRRIKKMRRYVDHVLACLPFEAKWFSERGCRATFVGHPFFDEVRRRKLDEDFMRREQTAAGPLVTILPGSRTQELEFNLPMMLEAAKRIKAAKPDAWFAVAAYKPSHARIARKMVADCGLAMEVYSHRAPELIHMADCCLAVSGSVSLELLYHARPTVIVYRVGKLAYRLQAKFRKVRYITLVNLLVADELYPNDLSPYDPNSAKDAKVLFPEYVTCGDESEKVAGHIVNWLTDRDSRAKLVERLETLKREVAHGGAGGHAAEYILNELARSGDQIPRPHFLPQESATPKDGVTPKEHAA